MDKYIEREVAINRIRKVANMMGFENPAVAIDCTISVLENTPAADVAPVRHARWEQYHDADFGWDEYGYQCTACHYRVEREKFEFSRRYCPWCGAIMDLED